MALKVLVACEYSGVVRDAFLAKGHDAMSCDLLPTESPGPHYQGDVMDLRCEEWDLVIAHPPCTYLSYAGRAWWDRPGRAELREEAVKFARQFEDWASKVAIENPMGYLREAWRREDQRINPSQFGDPYLKRTCLWLKGLPPLMSTELIANARRWCSDGSTVRSVAKNGSGLHRNPKMRAKFFPGVAAAMADQWG